MKRIIIIPSILILVGIIIVALASVYIATIPPVEVDTSWISKVEQMIAIAKLLILPRGVTKLKQQTIH